MNISQHPITGGMIMQLNRLDMISNNLANLNTTGYKEKHITSESFSSKLSEYPLKENLNFEKNTILSSNFVNQTLNMIPKAGQRYVNTKSGSIKLTNNPFDFAITEKDTYFLVKNPKTDDIYLTRDGEFIPEEGTLITKEGYIVLGNNLEAINTKNKNYEYTFAILKSDFSELNNVGDNLLELKKNSTKNINDLSKITDGLLLKRNLETSNINSVMEMTNLIDTNRLFEQLQKVSKTLQSIDNSSNSKMGNFKNS